MESDELLAALLSGKGDLGIFAVSSAILHNENYRDKFSTITAQTIQLSAVAAPNHPLARYKSVSPRTLLQYPVAFYQINDTPNAVYNFLIQFSKVKIHLSTSNLTAYLKCLQSGQAVGLLPKIKNSALAEELDKLSWITIKNMPPTALGYYQAPKLSASKSELCQIFLTELQKIL